MSRYLCRSLTQVACWVTAENVNSLIADNGFAGDVDLLSLDIEKSTINLKSIRVSLHGENS